MLALSDGDDEATRLAKVSAFAIVLALLIATEAWCRALVLWDGLDPTAFVTLAGATVFAAASFVPRFRRAAFTGLLVNQIVVVWHDFPATGNHGYLQIVLCALVALLDADEAEQRRILLQSIRWTVCVVLAASGLQKLVHGHWFDGQQLAYALWIPSFRPVLEPLLPAAEFGRLSALSGNVGQGPYVVQGAGFRLLSNAIWMSEIALVPLLLLRRTRVFAVVAALLLLVAIEAGAREIFFGLGFANALVVFLPGDWHRASVGVAVGICTVLLLVRVQLLPDMVFY